MWNILHFKILFSAVFISIVYYVLTFLNIIIFCILCICIRKRGRALSLSLSVISLHWSTWMTSLHTCDSMCRYMDYTWQTRQTPDNWQLLFDSTIISPQYSAKETRASWWIFTFVHFTSICFSVSRYQGVIACQMN